MRADDQHHRLAVETLEELEWCLEQLETMQTHRSVADMAATKARFLIIIEFFVISHFAKLSTVNSRSRADSHIICIARKFLLCIDAT